MAEGSCGGFFGPEMRRAGVDYIAIRGQADQPVYLHIQDGASGTVAELRDARHLWGLKTDETDALLHRDLADPDVVLQVAIEGIAPDTLEIDSDEIERALAAFTWQGIFKKIQKDYDHVLQMGH